MFSISSSFRSLVVSSASVRSRQWSHVTCQSRFSDFLPLFCPDDSIEQLEKLRSTFSPRASCSESSGRRCFANWPKRNQKIIQSHIEHGENFIRLVPAKVGAVRTANHYSLSQFSAFARDAFDDNFIEFIFFPSRSRSSTRLLARQKSFAFSKQASRAAAAATKDYAFVMLFLWRFNKVSKPHPRRARDYICLCIRTQYCSLPVATTDTQPEMESSRTNGGEEEEKVNK